MDNSAPTPSDHLTLVLGASGYVGGRLVSELLDAGDRVRCMSRSPRTLERLEWSDDVEIVSGDLLDPSTLVDVFDGVDRVVYLVHSLDAGEGFEQLELDCARACRQAAEHAGVDHIVYLSGLGADDEELSAHLSSRHAVGRELAAGPTAVTELRAAVILGAGSASFEMLRSLVEVLPAMVAPTWVTKTRVQPISIADVLQYLVAALERQPNGSEPGRHRVVEIGGPDVVTYRELMDAYCDVAGLKRRIVVPAPFVTPWLSTHWVNIVTPLPRQLAASLIDSLKNDVVVTDESAEELRPGTETLTLATGIELAIAAIHDLDVPTRWSGSTSKMRAAQPRPTDPEWSGGTVYQDHRTLTTTASPEMFQQTVRGIGGERGWYGFGWMWSLRGFADQLVGGVGLRRGRRHPDDIRVGEALDFWRVTDVETDLFRLHAEMVLPGEAWLEWTTSTDDDGRTEISQRARFVPSGVFGRIYWFTLVPFHYFIFRIMLQRIAADAEGRTAAASTLAAA